MSFQRILNYQDSERSQSISVQSLGNFHNIVITFVSYYKDGVTWIDGSFVSDLPMQRISELFNVNHFIVSQAINQFPFLFPYFG